MSRPFVPIEELAKHFSVSISTIRAWVRQGHIPKDTYIKVGNTYRFSIEDVAAALTNKDEDKPDTTVTVAPVEAVAEVSFTESDIEPDYNLDDDI